MIGHFGSPGTVYNNVKAKKFFSSFSGTLQEIQSLMYRFPSAFQFCATLF